MKKSFSILILIFIFCMLPPAQATNSSSNYESIHAINRSPLQVGFWQSRTPIIVICETAPTSEIKTRSAAAFWNLLGHEFQKVIYKQSSTALVCTAENPIGYIVVHLVSREMRDHMESDILAETHFYVERATKEIEWAKIYLVTDPPPMVLEHEIGHALGYLHYNKTGHLMHEKLLLGGWGTEGINK